MRRSPRSFARKSERLLRQAEIDLSHGCYEKAASASYFAVECAISALSLKRQGSVPRGYRSRLALVGRWLPDEAPRFDEMHRTRVRADHWDDLISREEAEKQLKMAREIIEKVLSMIKEDV